MAVLLFLAACLAVFVSVAVFAAATTAFHEILAAVIGLAACILFGCACIVDALNTVADRLKPAKKPAPEYGPSGELVTATKKSSA